MIWKAHVNKESRIRRKFALFPNKLDNGYSIWLDWYWAREEWWDHNFPVPGWIEVKTGFTEGFVQ